MSESNEYRDGRIAKLRDLEALGVDPFGRAFEFQDHAGPLSARNSSSTKETLEMAPVSCSLAGRIVAMRNFGKAAFATIQDSTGRMQVYLKKDILGEESYAIAKKLDIGDLIGVEGNLFRTKTDELTVEVSHLTFLTKSLLPLPEKWHGLKDVELRYRRRYLDLIVNPEVKETFRKRSAIVKAMRDFLESREFIEVETPMMQPIPGGATARPFVTHHNSLGLDLYLRIAPELYLKRLVVGGFERVFEINRNFRNEGISTKHNPEFTMLEFYAAYKDYSFLMGFTEELLSSVVGRVAGGLKVKYGEEELDFSPPFKRLRLLDALKGAGLPEDACLDRDKAFSWARANGVDVATGATFAKVLDEIFKEKVEPGLMQPTFVIDYPVELSPLARRKPDEPHLVERFELFIMGREIANAFSELNDPLDQRARFEEQVKAREAGDEEGGFMDEDYVLALEHGMPPAAGEGIGIDRLVMLLTDSPSIRDVILFPQMRPEADIA